MCEIVGCGIVHMWDCSLYLPIVFSTDNIVLYITVTLSARSLLSGPLKVTVNVIDIPNTRLCWAKEFKVVFCQDASRYRLNIPTRLVVWA